MNITTGSTAWTATLDHRTGATSMGGPASRYHRVARCDGRSDPRTAARPNYAARRLGVLLIALSGVMAGTWLVGEVAAGQPASAAAPGGDRATEESAIGHVPVPDVHVARDGDTLWSIADTHRGDIGRNRFVDALVELNGGTTIHVGQAVQLP